LYVPRLPLSSLFPSTTLFRSVFLPLADLSPLALQRPGRRRVSFLRRHQLLDIEDKHHRRVGGILPSQGRLFYPPGIIRLWADHIGGNLEATHIPLGAVAEVLHRFRSEERRGGKDGRTAVARDACG